VLDVDAAVYRASPVSSPRYDYPMLNAPPPYEETESSKLYAPPPYPAPDDMEIEDLE
jgi:hypothetical protein